MVVICFVPSSFLSTSSARRTTSRHCASMATSSYFYPRPPRGGRLKSGDTIVIDGIISIHVLREEDDRCSLRCGLRGW